MSSESPIQFEEDGFKYFKPASYVRVRMNENTYRTLDTKYDMRSIIHKIAELIDETADRNNKKVNIIITVPLYNYLTLAKNVEVISNIAREDQLDLANHIKRELLAVGGYSVTINQECETHTTLEIFW